MTTSTLELLSSVNSLLGVHSNLTARVREAQRKRRRELEELPVPPTELLRLSPIPSPSPSPSSTRASSPVPEPRPERPDLPPAKRARLARYPNYVPEEETIRNDYSQQYVDGGDWPQNWVLGAEPEKRFEEYPKQQRLLALKKGAVMEHALHATYLSLEKLPTLPPVKFDVILIDPPFSSSFSWDHLEKLPIPALAADPSFVFLWVGSGAGDGLERGREILGKWGYRRCEDVTWVKTNKFTNRGPGTDPPTTSLFTRTKQHCLMGIRGTVRRSTDNWFVHCNIDTDVIIWEGDPMDPTRKPPEMYTLIENFCLGLRRLEIFGRMHSLRRGWVTVTSEELSLTPREAMEHDMAEPFDKERWEEGLKQLVQGGKLVVPSTQDIENLRPKSPTPRGGNSLPSSQPAQQGPPLRQLMNSNAVQSNNHMYNNAPLPQMMAPTPNMLGVGMNMPQGVPIPMNAFGGPGNMGNMGAMQWGSGGMGMPPNMPVNMVPQAGFGFDATRGMMGVPQEMLMHMGQQPGFGGPGFNDGQGGMAYGANPGWMGSGAMMNQGGWDGSVPGGMMDLNNMGMGGPWMGHGGAGGGF